MTEKENINEDLKARQHELVQAMLVHVPFDGWGNNARDAAAEDLGISLDDAARLIPDQSTALDLFTDHADLEMAQALMPWIRALKRSHRLFGKLFCAVLKMLSRIVKR